MIFLPRGCEKLSLSGSFNASLLCAPLHWPPSSASLHLYSHCLLVWGHGRSLTWYRIDFYSQEMGTIMSTLQDLQKDQRSCKWGFYSHPENIQKPPKRQTSFCLDSSVTPVAHVSLLIVNILFQLVFFVLSEMVPLSVAHNLGSSTSCLSQFG